MNLFLITGTVSLEVRVAPATSSFEISEGDQLTVSGQFSIPEEPYVPSSNKVTMDRGVAIMLTRNDIYKDLMLRGYEYQPPFQGITQARHDGE